MTKILHSATGVAIEQAKRGRDSELRAVAAQYDPKLGRIVVGLSNGSIISFPRRLAEGLADATDVELSCVQVLGGGYGLYWQGLDVAFSVPSLLAGLFGPKLRTVGRRADQGRPPRPF